MEDVKELHPQEKINDDDESFNPCFNGRCKRTPRAGNKRDEFVTVSILVLMEDVKEHAFVFNG